MPLRHKDGQAIWNRRQRDRQAAEQFAIGFHINIFRLLATDAGATNLIGLGQFNSWHTARHAQQSSKHIGEIERAIASAAQHQPKIVACQ